MGIAACGVFDCEICSHQVKGRCPGCAEGNEAMVTDGVEACAIYRCSLEHGLSTCADCKSVVCQFTRSVELVCPVRAHFEKKRCYARKMADHFAGRADNASSDPQQVKVPEKSITRLRSYLFALDDYLAQGAARVSSDDISRKVGIKAHLIRRDLSQFGEFGRPSIGYDAAYLRTRLGQILHIDDSKDILWVGSSRLSQDSLLIKRFQDHGFNIVALFDTGTPAGDACVGGLPVKPFTQVISAVSELGAQAAVLAVSQSEAQSAADVLISAGIKGILNLTSAVIVAPPGVCVRNVDIVAELLALSYYCHGMHDSD